MPIVGRVKAGNLETYGAVDERLPAVMENLIHHYPLDQTLEAVGNNWDGLIGYWTLDDLSDSSGNNRHLIYNRNSGKLSPIASGFIDGAYETSSYEFLDFLSTADKVDLTGKSVTMSCWAFVMEAGNSANGLITHHNHNTNTGAGITVKQISTDDYRISCNSSNVNGTRTYHTYHGTTNIKNRWAHLAFRYDAPTKKMSLWVNGVKEYDMTYDLVQGNDYFQLFSWSTAYTDNFVYRARAKLDDVRLYDRALSDKEMEQLALYGKARKNDGVSFDLLTQVDGVSIDQTTVNHVSSPLNLSNLQGINADPAQGFVSDRVLETELGSTYERTVTSSDYRSTMTRVAFPASSIDVNQYASFSLYARCVEGTGSAFVNLNWEMRDASNARVDMSQGFYLKGNDWQRITLTGIPASVGAATMLSYTKVYLRSEINGTKTTIQIARPQMEQKPFATSFVAGSRVTPGNLSINLALDNEFTIFYKFRPNVFYPDLTGFNWTSKTMWYLHDRISGKRIWMSDYFKSGMTVHHPWIGFDEFIVSGTANWHWHTTNNVWKPDNEVWFALIKSGTTWRRVWINDDGTVYQTEVNMPQSELIAFSPNRLEFVESYNLSVRDVSVFRRALTVAELEKLAKNTFSVLDGGDVTVQRIKEQAINIPTDSLYLPFYDSATDIHNVLTPVQQDNLVFNDKGVWVGQSAFNLATGTFEVFTSYHSAQRDKNNFKFTMIGDSKYIVFKLNNLTLNTRVMSISGVIKKNGVPYVGQLHNWNTYLTNGMTRLYREPETGYFEITYLHNHTTNWLCHMPALNLDGDVITLDNLQVQEKTYHTPMTYDFREQGELEYNLHRDFGLDWSKDWTIAYWKMPVSTSYANGFDGYSLDSLGCNGNSVGGGYIWYGKSSSANVISAASPTEFLPANFFNKWRFVTLVKTGALITIKEHAPDGTIHLRSSPGNTTVPNFYVTQYGYDFKLGGWDNQGACNAYYRDMVIAKRALTDAELNAMRNTQMRTGKTQFIVQNSITENKRF